MGVRILSLFDGMACGMLAMQKAGLDVDEYFAYEIDKYAIKTATHNFPMIKECGDVFKADFTQYEGIDYVVGGSPCVPAGTKVKTDKGYKNIEDMTIGDMVLTHKNRYRPVTRLYKKVSDHLYHIRFNGNKTLHITGNHPVYTYRDNKFCFVRTDELTINDYVCININQANIPMDYSDDIMWLAGRALADGYLSTDKNAIVIAVGKKKIPDFEIHLQGLHYYVCHKDRPAVDYVIKDERLVGLYSYFGNNKATAKEIPDVILNLPVGQLKLVFDGYMSGDGFKRKDKPNVQMWCSSSEVLTLSMGLLTAKLFHKYPTISVRDGEYKKLPSGFCHTKTSYSSQISVTNRKNNDIQVIGDKLLIKIKSIEKESIEADVFNIETAEDHSYTVDNCIVHNCTYWSIAQKNNRETEASGLGWELFSQYVRAIHEAKPKFFIYENNKSMSNAIRESISKEFGFEPICINSALVSAQNRNRLYWVGKRNPDGTYSKVDVKQPEDRGILLKDILDSGSDFTTNDKSWTLTASYNGAVPWNTIERCQRNMVAEPVNLTADGKSQTIKAQYNNTSVVNACCYTSTYGATAVAEPVGVSQRGRYTESGKRSSKCEGGTEQFVEARTDGKSNCVTTVQKDSMVAVPVNPTADGKAQCLRATCYKDGIRNIAGNNVDRKTGIAEPIRVGALPRPNGELSTSQAMRVYDIDGKSVNICAGSGGMGGKTGLYAVPIKVGEVGNGGQGNRIYSVEGKSISQTATSGGMGSNTGLYAIPVEYENGEPTKALSYADNKKHTVYEVKDGQITIKEKQYPIKLADNYYIIRKLTVSECKRLQTVPEWYVFPVSDTQAYKMLGNSWTVDVIVHLIQATLE